MDQSEYKLMEFKYSEEESERIEEYNKNRIKTALDLLVYNRKKLMEDKEYAALSIEERINSAQAEFAAFCGEYPVVSKYIIAYGLFSTKAFIKYVDWKCKVRPSDAIRSKLSGNQREQEHFKNKYVYGVYIKFLYAEKNPKAGLKEINTAYLDNVKLLNEESDKFFDMYESAKDDVEKKEQDTRQERIDALKDQLKKRIATDSNLN